MRLRTLPRIKKEKKQKTDETTEQFVARVNKQEEVRNGKRIRFGFTKRAR